MTNRDSSDVFETLVVAAAMDWARCSQLVVFFLFRLLLLGRDFPPISEQIICDLNKSRIKANSKKLGVMKDMQRRVSKIPSK